MSIFNWPLNPFSAGRGVVSGVTGAVTNGNSNLNSSFQFQAPAGGFGLAPDLDFSVVDFPVLTAAASGQPVVVQNGNNNILLILGALAIGGAIYYGVKK